MLPTLWRAIRHEFGLKVLSLLVATGLWFYVMNTEDPIRDEVLERPVEVTNVPPGLELLRLRPEKVRLHFRGRVSGLQGTRLGIVRVTADLSQAHPGHQEVPLQVTAVPERVTVEAMERTTAHVWLEPRIVARKPVRPVVTGKPAPGCEVLGKPAVRPSEAEVSGAKQTLSQVAELIARVDISGLEEATALSADIEPVGAGGKPIAGLTVQPTRAMVDVPVFRVATARLKVRPRLGEPMAGHQVVAVTVRPEVVRAKGRPESLRGLAHIDTGWQDIADLRGTRTYHVPLVVPHGVWLVDSLKTVAVTVTVERQSVASSSTRPATRHEAQADTNRSVAPEPTAQGPARTATAPDTTARHGPSKPPPDRSRETTEQPLPTDGSDIPPPPDDQGGR